MRRLKRYCGFLLVLLVGTVGLASRARADDPALNPSLSLDTCDCERAANGLCRRWVRNDLSWQLYATGPADADVSNADLERAIIEAFATWQQLGCAVCSVYGTLPPLPAGASATARPGGDTGCVPTPCATNPLGLDFSYGGPSTQPQLASDCWAAKTPGPCDGAAENTSQIAFLRSDEHWPMSKLIVSTTFLSVLHDGSIIDADILLRDTTHVFCYKNCGKTQWDVRAALVLELGNALGLAAPATTATGEIGSSGELPTYIAPAVTNCACLVYRYSTDTSQCSPPDTSFSCDAGPQKPLPHTEPRWPWLACSLSVIALVGARRWRQRKGVNSAVPQRRA